MTNYTFVLPLPPSVNSLYGGGSGQRRFPSKKYKEWLAACPPLPALGLSRVEVIYTVFFKTQAAQDVANREKATTDYLVKQGVIVDDCWQHLPRMIIQYGGVDKLNPRIEVTIVPL